MPPFNVTRAFASRLAGLDTFDTLTFWASTLSTTVGYDYKKIRFILDHGYFSKKNIEHMNLCGYSFVITVKGIASFVNHLVLEPLRMNKTVLHLYRTLHLQIFLLPRTPHFSTRNHSDSFPNPEPYLPLPILLPIFHGTTSPCNPQRYIVNSFLSPFNSLLPKSFHLFSYIFSLPRKEAEAIMDPLPVISLI